MLFYLSRWRTSLYRAPTTAGSLPWAFVAHTGRPSIHQIHCTLEVSITYLRLAAKVRVPRREAVAPSGNQRRAAPAANSRASGRTREAVSTSGQQRGRGPGLPFSPRGPARGRGSTMASAEFSDERRLSNPDLSDDRRKSSVRRLSVNEPGKKNVKRGFQAGLTTEMEDEHARSRRPVG